MRYDPILPRHATIALILLISSACPSTLLAQRTIGPVDTTNAPPPDADSIGPPQLREFELPGTRVIPARPVVPPPATVAPPVQAPAPPIATPTPPGSAPPERAAPRQAPPVAARSVVPSTAPRAAENQPQAVIPDQSPVALEPAPAGPPLHDLEVPSAPEPSFSWAYALAAAAAAGLVGLLLLYRRRRNGEVVRQLVDGEATAFEPFVPLPAPPQQAAPPSKPPTVPAAGPAAAPAKPLDPDPPAFLVRSAAPAAKPAPEDGLVGIQVRPWLQLDFKPERAMATDTEATVQFELIIANTGNVVATNIRIDARIFNAGPQLKREIEAYFAAPIPQQSGGVIRAIPARSAASLTSRVSMPKHLVREIEIEGRRLFIPTVAINVCYEWGIGRTGRTSMSFLVGREPENPSSKMSPFRLDQGPRVYRQLGQRPSQPAVLV